MMFIVSSAQSATYVGITHYQVKNKHFWDGRL